ncbi:hypothetical protein PISL3812_02125 [Talaromyces islandicus]|uniref:superoxide dismutase n=1 Tax=Talaromyces islandicus TaxID=28573 RepID=A0A0U1LNZ7_TALIS|nr:hypothetical protein PISL3812_02125 [Talaromyces islandicus]
MYRPVVLVSLALSVIAQQFTEAPVITDNEDIVYTASLFDSTSSTIRGNISATAGPDGVGLWFRVSLTGLPDNVGPFPYHVHINKVPSDGNCTATGSHLDPYNRTEVPPCNSSQPATCQVGDLSGKHGAATLASGLNDFYSEYTDYYLSDRPESISFIGNRSIVVHAANGTRLNCGNFVLGSGEMVVPFAQPSSSSASIPPKTVTPVATPASSSATPTPTSVIVKGAASKLSGMSLGGLVMVIAAFVPF